MPGVSSDPRGDRGGAPPVSDDRLEPPHCPDRQVSPVQDRKRHLQGTI